MKKLSKIVALVGAFFMATMYANVASAEANPFAKNDQIQTIAGDGDGKCGEGKCGEGKKGKKG
ncbi:MAG: hypothetical protein OQK51_22640, partial [Kangiellaceae bacterium]|nr:hypothetical protein [Kangiellaceae bacterium]